MRQFAVLVLWIWDELLVAAIHDPIQVFQWNPAHAIRQRIRNLNHVKASGPALNFQGD